jgi:diguanylate cyclase (GGDEF)-like protein/PAS domain S-box-containing protein
MRFAPPVVNETERLAALSEYRLVEGEGDFGLDEIVRLTSQLLAMPIALVSLVERDRQFFKARIGVDMCETSREWSFCAHALALPVDDLLEVPDTLLDARFSDNPLVQGAPFIRFYAGAPLRAPLGHVIGTLCVADTEPRERLTDRERTNLRAMALMVLDRLELRRLSVAGSISQSRFENIAATSPDGIICSDADGVITFWNGACERLFGIKAARAIGSNLDIIVPPRMRGGHEGGMKRVADGGTPKLVGRTIELDAIHADGREFPVELSLSMWKESGRATFGAIIRDITARRADEARLFDLAHLDSLSGLPNRAVLLTRIADHVEKNRPFALLMLDLDGFKDVNDTLGHSAGDTVLRQATRRVLDCVGTADTVARLGGDEFSILMLDDDDGARAGACAQRILTGIAGPMVVDGQAVHVTASIGIARFPGDGRQVGDLLSAADLAMYHAKSEGRNCLRFFTHGLRDAVLTRRAFEGEIRRAIENEEFELFYQPQVRVADGTLLGLEALLRWRHPVEGMLAPYRFLSTIESGPFAADVGRWVMATACAHAVRLRERAPHLGQLRMGVNLFGAQFRTGRLAREVMEVLERTRLPPDALELEITENIILQHDELMLEPLRVLRTLGVGIAFDDYGTGFASLSMLKRYPITRLKIDRSFVKEICTDHIDAAIVEMVIGLTEKIGIEVIAEGVEEPEQRDALSALGCEVVQGYLYGKPMSVGDLDAFIAARPPAARGA